MNDVYDFPPVYNKKLAAAEKDACFLASSEHSRAERRLFRKYRFLLPEEVLRVVLIIACVVGAFFLLGYLLYRQPDRGDEALFAKSMLCVFVALLLVGMNYYLYAKVERDRIKLRNELDMQMSKIRARFAEEKASYQLEFEKTARETSFQFVEDELTQNLANWLSERFTKDIYCTSRGESIKQVRVPFSFNVEKNELVYGTERYNFEVHHYKNLSSPLEQAALAIAMATALEIEIRTKFPKDKSGTDITLDTKYVYTETHPNVTMTYIAENGNYKQ